MSVQILIVDDEEEIREMLARHFIMMDYVVDTAADGRDAIAILEEKRIDIVITDVLMQDVGGIKLLEYIHDHAPMIHCIVITGFVSLENALNCMRLGAEAFIFKPLEDLGELEDAVKKAEESMLTWQKKLNQLRGMRPSE